ncbi:3-oxoacyl-[acyl-carrier protein] reductase [Streptomyces sp. V3I8]|uniref:SDR family oxidoreductase n=1 Tax=Streptomyces sp. V3I8 TaxID=3042279 RepID=UPI00278B5925|nr:SDR family oxidoreductase [Streptomyces sp. V3I8]MDQ1039301.1 3-oxoacyl-[acyl-carrier protein] reductase [Streptomyces sp. V3I8]
MTDVEGPEYVPGHGLLKGRTAVVTAAAGAGIGGATARRFLEEGARVLISDAHERRLKEYGAALALEFEGVAVHACDVTDEAQVRALFGAALRLHGRLDIVVNNAGLGGTSDLVDMTDEQWSAVLDVTLNGTFRCTRAALRAFREAFRAGGHGSGHGGGHGGGRGGVIVNNASVVGWRAQAGQAHYAAAKAGVMALTRCAAMEAAAFGVRVNAVAPSLAMHPHLVKVTTPGLLEELTAREAFGRYAEPWEVANAIVFLASGYSSYLTGEVVSVSSQHA